MTRGRGTVGIVGSGPAALMAAEVLSQSAYSVSLFEKRAGLGWKLFIAGSSGLNISNGMPLESFVDQYTGPPGFWRSCLEEFPPDAWLQFIEKDLGIGTFLGTSGRYFVETMHAAKMIRAWRKRLDASQVQVHLQHECVAYSQDPEGWRLSFADGEARIFDCLIFCLGGGSYEEKPPLWPLIFTDRGIGFTEFTPMNSGFEIDWKPEFLQEAEALPLKNIKFGNARGERKGDLVITHYGLEGTPIYTLGMPGPAYLDLKPDLSFEEIVQRLDKARENLSPLRRAQRYLQLSPGAQALLFHHSSDADRQNLKSLAACIKHFPLDLRKPRPLQESISSRGGVHWDEVDERLMLRRDPGVFLAGEMLDWEAPTGGYLIQGCISQGAMAARHAIEHMQLKLTSKDSPNR